MTPVIYTLTLEDDSLREVRKLTREFYSQAAKLPVKSGNLVVGLLKSGNQLFRVEQLPAVGTRVPFRIVPTDFYLYLAAALRAGDFDLLGQ